MQNRYKYKDVSAATYKRNKKNGIRKFMVMKLSFSSYSLVVNYYVWYRFGTKTVANIKYNT